MVEIKDRRTGRIMSGVGVALLSLIAIVGIYVTVAAPFLIPHSLASSRDAYADTLLAARLADAHHTATGAWIDDDALAEMAGLPNVVVTPGNSMDFESLCQNFAGAKTDQLIVMTWRGEWADCLAYPSGLHTFSLSPWNYIFGSVGPMMAIMAAVTVACGFGIRALLRTLNQP